MPLPDPTRRNGAGPHLYVLRGQDPKSRIRVPVASYPRLRLFAWRALAVVTGLSVVAVAGVLAVVVVEWIVRKP